MKDHKLKKMKLVSVFAILISAIHLSGCGNSEERQVLEGIKKEVSLKFRRDLTNPEVEIKAFESTGSSIEPEYKTRFVITMKFREPMYEKLSTLKVDGREWTVVRQKHPEGGAFTLFGTSTSQLKNEVLVTKVDKIELGNEKSGWQLQDFTYGVVDGSKEHKAVLERLKQLEEQKSAAIQKLRDMMLGEWKGKYTCDADYDFTLNIVNVVSNPGSFASLGAHFADTQEPMPHSFTLNGEVTEAGAFDINPVGWLNRVGHQEWSGFKGSINEASGALVGEVKYRNCSKFELRRAD